MISMGLILGNSSVLSGSVPTIGQYLFRTGALDCLGLFVTV